MPQPFKQELGPEHRFKPAGAQLNNPGLAQAGKRPIAPPVYKPQPQQKVAQAKTIASVKAVTSAHGSKIVAPLVQSPQADRARPQSVPPPVYRRPAVQRDTRLDAGPPPPAMVRSVIQRSSGKKTQTPDCSAANFIVICSYSSDTAKNVRNAFLAAGYNMNTWGKAAIKAIRKSKWKTEKIAHGKGVEGSSGKRGGTDGEGQECAEYLIQWAASNPATCKPDKPTYNRRYDDDNDKGGGGGGKSSSNYSSSSGSSYIAPWHRGPAAWISQKT